MKALYLTGSIIFTVLILILAFENIGAQCSNLNFFFWPVRENPTFIFLGISVIGIFTGMLYQGFINKVIETTPEEEDEEF